MPMITVRYVTPKAKPEVRPQIAAFAAQLGAEHLGKIRESPPSWSRRPIPTAGS
jgi:hypothetical protein